MSFLDELNTKIENVQKPKNSNQAAVNAYRHRAIPLVSTAIEIIALLGLSGLLTFVQFNGKINEVAPYEFALYMVMRLIMLFLSKDASARSRVENGQKEEAHTKLVDELKAKAKEIKDRCAFDTYIKKVENPRRKIQAWRDKINPKIGRKTARLEKLSTLLKIAEKKGKARRVERLKAKIETIKSKIAALQAKVSDEYVRDNYYILRARYTKVNINQFFVADLNGEVNEDVLEINVDFESRKGIVKTMPLSIVLILFTTLVGLDSVTLGSLDILTLFLDVLSVAFYMSLAWFSIGAKTLAKQRKVLINKTVFIDNYLSRIGDKPSPV